MTPEKSTSTPRRTNRKVSDQTPTNLATVALPYNAEMERNVIAAMLSDSYALSKAVEILRTEHAFYVPAHRHIFRVMLEIFNSENATGIDIFVVADKLKREGLLDDMGGEPFLAEIQNTIANTANCEAWILAVQEHFILRKMIQTCTDSVQRCITLTDNHNQAITPHQTIDMVESEILRVRSEVQHHDLEKFNDLLTRTCVSINNEMLGQVERALPTGFDDIDRKIQGGMKRGEMIVLAARPSIGKTSFALNIIRNVLMKGKRVAFFSLEMTAEQIARRLLCNFAKVPESQLVPNSQFYNSITKRLQDAGEVLSRWHLVVDPTPQLRIMELRAKARRLMQQNPLDFIAVDYLQLMRGAGNAESRQIEVADISSGLKGLAKELNIPILALAQLSRESEKVTTPNARPKLSHLRESGAIEQDADIVAFLHRDRDKQKDKGDDPNVQVDAECIIEKNRNGEIGRVDLFFAPSLTEFRSKSRFAHSDEPKDRDNR